MTTVCFCQPYEQDKRKLVVELKNQRDEEIQLWHDNEAIGLRDAYIYQSVQRKVPCWLRPIFQEKTTDQMKFIKAGQKNAALHLQVYAIQPELPFLVDDVQSLNSIFQYELENSRSIRHGEQEFMTVQQIRMELEIQCSSEGDSSQQQNSKLEQQDQFSL